MKKIIACIKRGNVEQLKLYRPEKIQQIYCNYSMPGPLEVAIAYNQREAFDYLITILKPYEKVISFALRKDDEANFDQHFALSLIEHNYPVHPQDFYDPYVDYPEYFKNVDWKKLKDSTNCDVIDHFSYRFIRHSHDVQKNLLSQLSLTQKIRLLKKKMMNSEIMQHLKEDINACQEKKLLNKNIKKTITTPVHKL